MSRPLPPLNAVRAFEAASRHLNLSRAAEELGVTQGAISKQVIALEDYIGAQLFNREAGGLSLTNEGGSLKEAIYPAFIMLGEAFARYSRRPAHSNVVRISTVSSFASQFLVPRLTTFKQRHPGIELEFHTSIRIVDLAREGYDLAVRHGPGNWEGVVSEPLIPGSLLPICSPQLFRDCNGDLATLFSKARRIQSSAYNEWRDWAEAADYDLSDLPPTFMMEEFLVAMTAVMYGEGLALSPEILVRERLKRGELVLFSPVQVKTNYTFHVTHTPSALRRPVVRDVVEWLKAEAAEHPDLTG